MKKILLMGNPNVGKSAIFSRLTGAKVIISNYPGSTIEFLQGYMKIGSQRPMIIDVPGTYSLEPSCKAEEVAVQMLKEGDLIINVVDATNLERNSYLTLQLLERNIPVIIALNMWDETRHKGIHIDTEKLQNELGVPVVPVCGLTGEGIRELALHIENVKSTVTRKFYGNNRWEEIGKIIDNVQSLTHRHHTFLERLEDLSIKPATGLLTAFFVMYCSFWIIRLIAEGLIKYVLEPFFYNVWMSITMKLSSILAPCSFLQNLLIGNLFEGKIDFGLSFGLLTTGLYVPLAMVLPYILSFYLVLGILEDFGYLPRLAVLVDNFMHQLGLHGYAIIPFILGLGCNVPGILAVRILESKREKFIAATLTAVAVPCIAQIAMIVGLVGARGGRYVIFIFFVLFCVLIIKGLILNKILKGQSPEILVEIPPYRIPHPKAVTKKLWMRLSGFLREAVPFVLLGVLLVNILHTLKIINLLTYIFSPILVNLWGLPKEAVFALLAGFLRKDIAVGMLGPLNLTNKQLVTAVTVMALYFPCIATFAVLIRELGVKDMLKTSLSMLLTALIVGTVLNFVL